MTAKNLPSEILHGAPFVWLALVELILINALIYAQLRASGFDEVASFTIATVFLLSSILVPHYFAPQPSQYRKRLSLVHHYIIPILVLVWLVSLVTTVKADKDFLHTAIQLLILYLIAPIFYVSLIFLNVVLIRAAPDAVSRVRNIFGAIAGGLLGVIGVIILQQVNPAPVPSDNLVVLIIVVALFSAVGYLVILYTDRFLSKGAISVINLVTTATSVVSVYLLVWSSSIFASFALGFLVGNALYLMMTPAAVSRFSSRSRSSDSKKELRQ